MFDIRLFNKINKSSRLWADRNLGRSGIRADATLLWKESWSLRGTGPCAPHRVGMTIGGAGRHMMGVTNTVDILLVATVGLYSLFDLHT